MQNNKLMVDFFTSFINIVISINVSSHYNLL